MKRFWKIALLVGIVAIFGLVSVANAQGSMPPTPPVPGQGYYGPGGMMGSGAGRGYSGMMGGMYGQGAMHDYMEKAIADKLGISVDALEEQHDQGKTFWQIAEEKGLTVEQAQQLMLDARSLALDQMVQDHVITQEQADWMKTRMSGGQFGGCMGGGRWNNGGTAAPRGQMGGGRW